MTLENIQATLQSGLRDGQLILNQNTLIEFDLSALLNVLNSPQLVINEAVITAVEESLTLSGKAQIFGSDPIGLDLIFTANGEAIALNFAATVPIGQVPGLPWLSMANLQVALAVVGDQVTGTLSGALLPGSGEAVAITLAVTVGETVQWQSELRSLPLSSVAELFLNTRNLPPDVPDFVFSTLALSLIPSTGEFSLQAAVASEWAFANQTLAVQVGLSVERLATMINAQLTIQGDGPLAIADELSLQNINFALVLEAGDWLLAGDVTATLFDETLTLLASYGQRGDRQALMVSIALEDGQNLVTLPEIGAFGISNLALTLNQSTVVTEPASWALAAAGGLVIDSVLDLQGTLTLSQAATTTRLVFVPEAADVLMPLIPSQELRLRLRFGDIAIVRQAATGTSPANWAFTAEVASGVEGLPAVVHQVLPPVFSATFRADRDRVSLIADRVVNAADVELPSIDINDLSIPLGTVRIDVVNLGVRLDTDVSLSADIALGLPSDLNNLLGVDATGEPLLELFNTFDPDNPDETTVNLRLEIAATGISVTPVTSPLRAVRTEEENGIVYWHVDMGAFGAVRLQLPVFSYNAARSSFMSSGGFEVIRPLSLPLTPFQRLLEAAGLQAIADTFPDSLPLQDIQLLDEDDNFRTEELQDLLSLAGDIPDELEQAIELVGDRFDQLPDSFRNYLNVEIPDGFVYEIAIIPNGTVRVNARVPEGSDPVRLLYPSQALHPLLLVQVPTLTGIELWSIAFGPFSGGKLFLLEIDANFDEFDLITLAASLALSDLDEFLPFPDSRDFQRRTVLRNLFMLIVYQTVIPIPVPLFYDEVGIEYLGLEGVKLQTHAQFPMPSFDLLEISAIVADLVRFFSDRDFLLNPNTPPDNVNLSFSLDSNYLRLPEYLGSAMLGPGMAGPEINAYANLAHLLNGLKTLSINELIQAMPLEYRVSGVSLATPDRLPDGNLSPVDLSFVSLQAQMGWLITTPGEYQTLIADPIHQAQIFEQLQLADETAANDLLAILPAAEAGAPTSEAGLVTFLKGTWNLVDVAELEAAFGLVASGTQGFRTGFRIAGQLENLIDLELAGRVAIGAPANVNILPPAPADSDAPVSSSAFQLAGHSHLTLLNHRIFTGDLQATEGNFSLRGDLTLFPEDFPAQVNGQLSGLIDSSTLNLSGSVTAELAGLTLADAQSMISDRAIRLQGSWLGVTPSFSVTVQDDAFAVAGALTVDVPVNLNIGPLNLPGTNVRLVDELQLDTRVAADIAVSVTESGFSAPVSGSFQWNGRTWQLPEFTVDVAFQDIAALASLIGEQIQSQAAVIFDDLLAEATAWLRAVRDRLIQFTGDVATVLRDGYQLAAQAAAQALRAAGYTVQQVGEALAGAYAQTAVQAARILRSLNYTLDEIGAILRDRYRLAAQQAGQIFLDLRLRVDEVGQLLRRVYSQSAQRAAQILRNLGYSALNVGFVMDQVYRQAASQAARILGNVGYGVEFEVGRMLQNIYRLNAEAAARALRATAYPARIVGGMLMQAYSVSATSAARTLRVIGYSARDVGFVVRDVYRQSVVAAANIFRSAGFSAQAASTMLQGVYSANARQVADHLARNSFPRREIEGALRSTFGVSRDAAEDLANRAVDTFEDIGNEIGDVFDRFF
ncbi:MAG: hypothetical protein AAF892_05775 [Cyanobacteria bacterium P01_D01_bin.71]